MKTETIYIFELSAIGFSMYLAHRATTQCVIIDFVYSLLFMGIAYALSTARYHIK